jgi:hypothetical protein
MFRTAVLISLALAAALAAPARALAAAKPSVTTGGVSTLAQQSATLNGRVNPNGLATTYFFQYGPTIIYGSQSAATPIGAGTKSVAVSAAIGGLAPASRYHYRLVAQNSKGTTVGADRTFTTRRQPLGVTLAATPNPVPYGSGTTLAGTLTGTGNANRVVQLQANPFPYTQGFQPVGNSQLTNAQGGFSFLLPPVPINTQYRVLMPEKPSVVSPIVSVGVAVRVSTHVRRTRTARGLLVRFSGTVRPARDGAQFAIQKRHGSKWVTINGGITHHSRTGTFSRYSKRIRLRHGGTFRVFVGIVDGNYVSNVGRSVHIRVR